MSYLFSILIRFYQSCLFFVYVFFLFAHLLVVTIKKIILLTYMFRECFWNKWWFLDWLDSIVQLSICMVFIDFLYCHLMIFIALSLAIHTYSHTVWTRHTAEPFNWRGQIISHRQTNAMPDFYYRILWVPLFLYCLLTLILIGIYTSWVWLVLESDTNLLFICYLSCCSCILKYCIFRNFPYNNKTDNLNNW